MAVASYRELRVWQGGIDLVKDIYRITRAFPATETYALSNQMQRAAVSIPSNIAEGYARRRDKEYSHFLSIAQGSLAELDTQLEIARQLGNLAWDEHEKCVRRSSHWESKYMLSGKLWLVKGLRPTDRKVNSGLHSPFWPTADCRLLTASEELR
ncbi:MAG: four helix bundle protein [SAR202 cluster bacterium]|nr:four helix bundle protein [SAR202 cluster bacterium]